MHRNAKSVVFLAGWMVAAAAWGAIFTVPAGDVANLIATINTANTNGEGNTINLGTGAPFTLTAVNNTTDGANGLPSITSRMTIQGNGGTAIVERSLAAPLFRIFHVAAPGMLTLMDLTIRNGHARGADAIPTGGDGKGGAAYSYLGYFSASSCTFTDNIAEGGDAVSDNAVNMTGGNGYGGAIYGLGGTVGVWGCTLDGNAALGGQATAPTGSANSRTGGIGYGGAVAMESGGPNDGIWPQRSRFTMNNATGGDASNPTGTATGGTAYGGAIWASSPGNLGAEQSVVTSCQAVGGMAGGVRRAGWGGGLSLAGSGMTMSVTNMTFSGNSASGGGGGAYLNPTSAATLRHCTIANNTADADSNGTGDGGGVSLNSGTLAVEACIVAQNTDTGGQAPDVAGAFTSVGFNLIGDGTGATGFTDGVNNDLVGTTASPRDPVIGLLADNGGETETRALLDGSPAIDYIPEGSCSWYNDQRGLTRPQHNACDIGAYEKSYFTCKTLTAWPAGPTNADTLDLGVGFNDLAFNFNDISDLVITTTGSVTYTGATGFAGGMNFAVQLEGIAGDGTITVSVRLTSDVVNSMGDPIVESVTCAPVTIDNTPPVIAIGAPSKMATQTDPVTYTITYPDASAITLDVSDITLDATGTATGVVSLASITSNQFLVTIDGISGEGTLGISIAADTATDEAGNSALAAGPSATFIVGVAMPLAWWLCIFPLAAAAATVLWRKERKEP